MLPDIVYLYARGYSRWREQELRFSLRSLEKYGMNYGNVFLIGDKPPYLNEKIKHVQKNDEFTHCKERKIYEKILFACNLPEISDPFIFFNDDYFLVKPIDFSTIDYYYNRELGEKIKNRPFRDAYLRALKNTRSALLSKEYTTKHFDIHYPAKYHKEKFIKVMGQYDWRIPSGFVIKSLYANTLRVKGKNKNDCKIQKAYTKAEIKQMIENTDLISTDEICRALAETIIKTFPEQSSYEIVFDNK